MPLAWAEKLMQWKVIDRFATPQDRDHELEKRRREYPATKGYQEYEAEDEG